MTHEVGVTIEAGAQDWQIFQKNARGTADISLAGRWSTQDPYLSARVVVRIVHEESYEVVSRTREWTRAKTADAGTWEVTIRGVPTGGLYRIETGLQLSGQPVEWSQRGDMVHHIGVGDVWVIAGQSNSSGYGKAPAVDGPELGVHMFHARGRWQEEARRQVDRAYRCRLGPSGASPRTPE